MKAYLTIALAAALGLCPAAASAQGSAIKRLAEKLSVSSVDEAPEAPAEEAAAEGEAPQAAPAGGEPVIAEAGDETAALERPAEEEGELVPTIGLPMETDGKSKKGESQINLGKESEEQGQVANLFADPNVLKLIGDKPRFIYNAEGRPDPMVFPPIRNAAIYSELSIQAEALEKENKLTEALVLYDRILSLNDRRFTPPIREKVAQLHAALGNERAAAEVQLASANIAPELPEWVRENTSGVLLDSNQSMCLVGDFLLKAGDAIPTYPNVKVTSIEREKVVFEVSETKFDVDVKGYDEWGAAEKPTAPKRRARRTSR